MSFPPCGVCHEHVSNCSIPCYKSHAPLHTAEEPTVIQQQQQQQQQHAKRDRPGTTQRVAKADFTGFEQDLDFARLLARYPTLKPQLQLAYALTLEPGPSEKWTWNKQPLLASLYPEQRAQKHPPTYYSRGRGGRGGRGGRVAFRAGRGGSGVGGLGEPPEDRQHGLWTQAKGDKEALLAVQKMRMGDGGGGGSGGEVDDWAEGMREFVELCLMKFGDGRERE
ncbi:hypothetical protein LTR53_014000 [Teratosphaeriaceae sp. CCFEE 6253]|nr:hypothetical protein LTR53_014000 [Teratosphaeriaceae sp. CCFEE 6253]